MELITLNTWGGRAGRDGLLKFLEEHKDIDVFCLQEIWSAPYEHLEGINAGNRPIDHKEIMTHGMQEISLLLSEHQSYFHPHHLENYGLQMLVKKNLDAAENGDVFVYKEKGYIPEGDVGNHGRNIQYVTLETKMGFVTVMNFHGLWNGKGKTDSEDRINQSKRIVEFVNRIQNDFVLCGDFNLLPDTESIRILEEAGFRNLIKEYGVQSTRTSHYQKPEKHADYIFVTKGIDVKNFQVLSDVVSDHAPLFLDFDLR